MAQWGYNVHTYNITYRRRKCSQCGHESFNAGMHLGMVLGHNMVFALCYTCLSTTAVNLLEDSVKRAQPLMHDGDWASNVVKLPMLELVKAEEQDDDG